MLPQTTTQDSKTRNKKSTKVQPGELRLIKKYAEKFDTKEEAAVEMGIHRDTLRDIFGKGTCAGTTLIKLVEKGIIPARTA